MDINKIIDGETHINVYSKGNTKIGRFYSNFHRSPIETEDGYFESIEAYWYWILTDGQTPRDTYGYNAKSKGKEKTKVREIDEEKIKKAIDIKIKKNILYVIENDNFELPLVHYYDYGGKRIDAGYKWIIEHIQLRREQLKDYYKNKK